MDEKRYTLKEIEQLLKTDTSLHKNALKCIRQSILGYVKDHPKNDLNDKNHWPSISKRICGQLATCIHNEQQKK